MRPIEGRQESSLRQPQAYPPISLTIARERLGVDESPQPLWGLPVTWAQFRP
jgi:hypothetical protein